MSQGVYVASEGEYLAEVGVFLANVDVETIKRRGIRLAADKRSSGKLGQSGTQHEAIVCNSLATLLILKLLIPLLVDAGPLSNTVDVRRR
jgi:hypothetical protein